jgi:hypothetical protein
VNCPLDCEHLRDARRHEKAADVDLAAAPNQDIRVSEKFVEEKEPVLSALSQILLAAALDTPGAVDFDVREALDALIRTYRTLQSGFYYESIPTNALAAAIYGKVQDGVAYFREEEKRALGMSKTRDADILGLLVFLQRFELTRNNGRPRGRAFIGALQDFYPAALSATVPVSPLILP